MRPGFGINICISIQYPVILWITTQVVARGWIKLYKDVRNYISYDIDIVLSDDLSIV